METLPQFILMLGLIGTMAWVSQRVTIPAPVLFAIAGVAWSLVPRLPRPAMEPELVLTVFLPPLLYADAWEASWIDFRRWLRPILQLAVGLVAFTILAVGLVAHALMPQLPWAACFLLGAIVSPTDTIAVHAMLSRLRAPRRATAILGGESLINDATGLLGAGLAIAVVMSGVFDAAQVGTSFARIAGLGLIIGTACGMAAATINYFLRGTQVLFVFSLLAPYTAYFLAEHAGASGVLAVVVAGFVASWRLHYIAPESRVELYSAWEQLTFVLYALMFLYVGLEAPTRLKEAVATVPGILGIALVVCAAVILARLVFIPPNAYLPPWLLPRLRRLEGGYPAFRGVILVAWCGIRGAVSLAAALSIPALLPDGSPFPGRAEIVACTLVVILVTLIGQGLTLMPIVRRLGLSDADTTEVEVHRARETILAAGIARLDAFCSQESCPIAVYRLREVMTDRLAALQVEDALARSKAKERLAVTDEVRRAIYRAQTDALLALRDRGEINDSVHQLLQLDLDRASAELRES